MTKLTFLGTGTSQGVPVISCGCEVCLSNDPRDKRLRTSAMFEKDDTRIIIDAGPDFRQQMLRENVKNIDAILLTHEHKDHTGGIDDVRAFNYTQRSSVNIYATEKVQRTIKKDFDYAFEEDKYPGAPEINLVTITDEPFYINNVLVIPIFGKHYAIPVVGFRIGGIAYLTDFNYISDEEIEKIKGVEILVINALRKEKHISHFSLGEALQLRTQVKAAHTYITHSSHQMGLYKSICTELPPDVTLAYDGLVVELNE